MRSLAAWLVVTALSLGAALFTSVSNAAPAAGGGTIPAGLGTCTNNCTIPAIEGAFFSWCATFGKVSWFRPTTTTAGYMGDPFPLSALAGNFDAAHAAHLPWRFEQYCYPSSFTPTPANWAQAPDAVGAGISIVKWRCDSASYVSDPAQCPATACPPSGQLVNLELPISGANPSATEYVETCFNSCKYGINQASIFKDPTAHYFMVGKWSSMEQACTAGIRAFTSSEISADPSDAATVQPGESPITPDGCSASDPACAKTKILDAMKGQTDILGPDGKLKSSLGPVLAFPHLPFLTAPTVRVCSYELPLPNSFPQLVRSWIGNPVNITFCSRVEDIDRIGGWLLGLFTALVIWSMYFKTGGT